MPPPHSCLPTDWNRQTRRYNPDSQNIWFRLGKLSKNLYLLFSSLTQISNSLNVFWYLAENSIWNLIGFLDHKAIKGDNNCPKAHSSNREALAVKRWMKDLEKHQKFMNGAKKQLFTVMQPNQYDPEAKTWTQEEKLLFAPYEIRKKAIEKIYPLAGQSFVELQKKFPKTLLDFRAIYKNENSTVYSDGCCHVNKRGNEIFAARLFQALKQNMSWETLETKKPPR